MLLPITYNASLKDLNTFGVPSEAWALVSVERWLQVAHAVALADDANRPLLVLGEGSNLLLRGDYPGLVLRIHNQGCQIVDERNDQVKIRVAAGERWHAVVMWAASQGLWGIENLALIPGMTGAAPMQNIGAYGAELAQVLTQLNCYDRVEQRWRTLDGEACHFGYRTSRFREADAERFVITECVLTLTRDGGPNLSYPGVQDELEAFRQRSGTADGTPITPLEVARAVSALRRKKLPSPEVVGNAGSFFKNPVVAEDHYEALRSNHPDLPAYPAEAGHKKLSAAWMIEACGWRGERRGDAGVSERHSLVLVNHGDATGQEIWQLAQDVARSVHETFGVNLEPEPQLL
ncbi:MAG: UDP-N-acetylmuramate dehydrogenase [Pseudomonadota bacterium]